MRFEGASDGLRHAVAADFAVAFSVHSVPGIAWTNFVYTHGEVVTEGLFDVAANVGCRSPMACQPNGQSDGLCSLNALRMVVRAFGRGFGHFHHFFACLRSPTHRADAHAAAVTHRVVGGSHFVRVAIHADPFRESSAVTSSGIGDRELCVVRADVPAVEDPVGGGSRQYRIVGEEECAFCRSVKRKALGFDVAELVDAAYDVADKAADHEVEV